MALPNPIAVTQILPTNMDRAQYNIAVIVVMFFFTIPLFLKNYDKKKLFKKYCDCINEVFNKNGEGFMS